MHKRSFILFQTTAICSKPNSRSVIECIHLWKACIDRMESINGFTFVLLLLRQKVVQQTNKGEFERKTMNFVPFFFISIIQTLYALSRLTPVYQHCLID